MLLTKLLCSETLKDIVHGDETRLRTRFAACTTTENLSDLAPVLVIIVNELTAVRGQTFEKYLKPTVTASNTLSVGLK